jgi:hypothetical protein
MKRSTLAVMAALSACSSLPVPQSANPDAQLSSQLENRLLRLEQACVADPANAQAWERLSGALEAMGQEQRAHAMAQQARSLREHDLNQDYAMLARTEVRQIGAAMVEVRRVAAAGAAPALPVPLPPADSVAAPARLEISNGNGVRGLAAAWARELKGEQWRLVRLTNSRPFVVARTRLEYGDAQQQAAQALAQRLGVGLMAANSNGSGQPELRIVLGHDMRADAGFPLQPTTQKKPPASGGRQAP